MPCSKDDRPAPLSAQAPWKIVFFHHPPYSSGSTHGSNKVMQWPFAEWGANLILGALLNAVHSEHYLDIYLYARMCDTYAVYLHAYVSHTFNRRSRAPVRETALRWHTVRVLPPTDHLPRHSDRDHFPRYRPPLLAALLSAVSVSGTSRLQARGQRSGWPVMGWLRVVPCSFDRQHAAYQRPTRRYVR